MGVLDDAIREHIELKRTHGASETELERQEREALGPARREPAPAAESPPRDVDQDAQDGLDLAHTEVLPTDEAEVVGPPESDEDFVHAESYEFDEAEPQPPAADDPPAAVAIESEPFADAGPWADPPPVPAEHADAEDEEDVLEETPEFLQDAPEHDRLWFEQKPPRDFDFDDE